MAIPVQSIVDSLGFLLQDETAVRWTNSELFKWINEAAKKINDMRPAAGKSTEIIQLAAGAHQEIDCNQIADIIRNESGPAITRTDRQILDAINPTWYEGTESSTIVHFMVDDRNPDQCYVYPPAVLNTSVEALLYKDPAEITALADSLAIDLNYKSVVVDYCAWRCLSKDTEEGNINKAMIFLQNFNTALGIKNTNQIAVSPNGGEA